MTLHEILDAAADCINGDRLDGDEVVEMIRYGQKRLKRMMAACGSAKEKLRIIRENVRDVDDNVLDVVFEEDIGS